MSLLIGTVGASIPQLPAAKDPYTWSSAAYVSNSGNSVTLPSTLNDGSYFLIATNLISLFNAAGTLVWSKAPTVLNASATNILLTAWIDTVDGAIYLIAGSASVMYPTKIIISTGVVSSLGAGITPGAASFANLGGTSVAYLLRAAQGSGDFTIFGWGAAPTASPRQIGFNSVTGVVTSAEAAVLSGSVAVGAITTTPKIGYKSLDGTILLVGPISQSGTNVVSGCIFPLYRNGKFALFEFNAMPIAGASTSGTTQTSSQFTAIGNYVMLTNGQIFQGIFPMMLRSDFDTFLAAACTYMGI